MRWRSPAERLRRMYRGGRGNASARRFSWIWVHVIRTGLLPERWVVLEVPGRRRRPRRCRLVEVAVSDRVTVLGRYQQKVPGGRPHIPAGVDASTSELSAIADRYPVFRVAEA